MIMTFWGDNSHEKEQLADKAATKIREELIRLNLDITQAAKKESFELLGELYLSESKVEIYESHIGIGICKFKVHLDVKNAKKLSSLNSGLKGGTQNTSQTTILNTTTEADSNSDETQFKLGASPSISHGGGKGTHSSSEETTETEIKEFLLVGL